MSTQPDPRLADFRNFLYVIWKFLGLPEPTKRQYAIAYFLQHGPRRQIIEAFRGVGKSWITAAFVCFILYHNPQLNILVVSGGKARADDFSKFARLLIQAVPILQHLQPTEGQRSSSIAFDVGPAEPDQSPSVKSAGITGMITGSRADIIIADDIETPDNSDTVAMREKIQERVKEFDAILKPGGRIIYLGTPQTEDTLYDELVDRGYSKKIWCVRYPTLAEIEAVDGAVAEDIIEDMRLNPALVGTSTEPTRFTEMDLQERELSYGRSGFALQYMLNTKMRDAEQHPFRLRDLMFYSLAPDFVPDRVMWNNDNENIVADQPNVGFKGDRLFRGIVMRDALRLPLTGIRMGVDPSGRGRDETAYAVVGCLHGQMFLLESGGFMDGYGDATLLAIANIAKKWKVNQVLCEPNYGGGMFTKMLQAVMMGVHKCEVKDSDWAKGNKEQRICDVLEPVISNHRLIVNADLIDKDHRSTADYPKERAHQYQLFYQLTRIRREKGVLGQDDRIEALAIAVNSWVDSMAQSTAVEVDRAKERLRKEEMVRFLKFQVGQKPEDLRRRRSWGMRP